jgi:glycosyltransferase involved in cell wall biosynthesis
LTWKALTVRGPFDGVEGHFLLPAGPIAVVAARIRRLPLVVYAHGTDVRDQAWRTPVHRWLARQVARSAAVVVASSSDTATWVRRLGRDPVVVPPGIDVGRFSPTPRPPRRRVLYLGGDVAGKGVETARRLADTLVGPGIREIAPSEVPALMASHDVILVPSLQESFGLVAAEAIASGRWVVAAATGGLVDVVTDGVSGTLVRDGDYDSAVASVPDYDPKAVAAGRSRFDIRRSHAAMAAIWREVIEGQRGGRGARARS